jgi:hypothetical protein
MSRPDGRVLVRCARHVDRRRHTGCAIALPTTVEILVNAGAQTGANRFAESDSLPVNAETETLTVIHVVKTVLGFSVGGRRGSSRNSG